MPIVGDALEVIQLLVGIDLETGEDISLIWRAIGVVLLLLPIVDRRVLKWLVEALAAIKARLSVRASTLISRTTSREAAELIEEAIASTEEQVDDALATALREIDNSNRLAVQEAIEEGSLTVVSPRSALIRAASGAEHHIFTQSRRGWFKSRYGIDVDDFVVDVDALTHEALHAGKSPLNNRAGWWDHELITRIRDAEAISTQKLTRDEVLEIGRDMLKRFGLDHLSVHRYTKSQ